MALKSTWDPILTNEMYGKSEKGKVFQERLTCYAKEPESAGPFLSHGDVSVTPQTAAAISQTRGALRTKGMWANELRVTMQSEETPTLVDSNLRFPITGHYIL